MTFTIYDDLFDALDLVHFSSSERSRDARSGDSSERGVNSKE